MGGKIDKGRCVHLSLSQKKKNMFIIQPLENQFQIMIALKKFWSLFQKNGKKENFSLRVTNLSILDL